MSDSECSPPTAKKSRQVESADIPPTAIKSDSADFSPSVDFNEPSNSNNDNGTESPTIQRSAIKKVLAKAKLVVLQMTEGIDENNKMRDDTDLVINQAFETLQRTLQLRKEALLSELESVSLSNRTALTLQKEKFENIESTSLKLLTHTDDEIAALGGFLPIELCDMLKKVESFSLPNMHSDIHVDVKTGELEEELSKFGYISDLSPSSSSSTWTSTSVAKVKSYFYLEIKTKTSKGTMYPHGGLQVKAEMRCNNGGVTIQGEVDDNGDGTYTITIIPQTSGPHQLLITLNGQHVHNSPHDLNVLPNYKLVEEQVIKCPKAPSGIAIHDNGNIYVATAEGCVYVFDKAGHVIKYVGGRELKDGLLFKDDDSWPTSDSSSITIIDNKLYVAGKNRQCVKRLNLEGEIIQTFSKHEVSGILLDNKYYTTFVSDCNAHKINVLNHNGGLISTINGNVIGDCSFKSPYGLAFDPLGNIHVAASESNTIKVFTKKGDYIRKYGNLKGPRGIVIDGKGYSFVTEFEGTFISIFDPKGNKIDTKEVTGKPFGLVLDSKTSSLYVCDYGAHIVLKYSF